MTYNVFSQKTCCFFGLTGNQFCFACLESKSEKKIIQNRKEQTNNDEPYTRQKSKNQNVTGERKKFTGHENCFTQAVKTAEYAGKA